MNPKLLFPTYRQRHRFVLGALDRLAAERPLGRVLHLGTGEGDYDPAIRRRCDELAACDINPDDVAHARALNASVPGIAYAVEDAEALSYADASFDAVVCVDVIEHVARPTKLLAELRRVLRDDGRAVLTCPSERFPFVYDPVNAALRPLGKHVPIGAYAYGHTWLVRDQELERWFGDAGLRVRSKSRLSRHLSAAIECYWPGLLQRMLKANAGNRHVARRRGVRPTSADAPLVAVTDAIAKLDESVFAFGEASVGLGYVLEATRT